MAIVLENDSTITEKGQTTVPKPIRDALGLRSGDRIRFRLDERGVTVHRIDEQADPALEAFLAFLARDMTARPQAVAAVSQAMASRITELTEGVEVDLEEEIEGEADL